MESKDVFQNKHYYKRQNTHKLDYETSLGIAFAAEYHRQRQTQGQEWRNVVDDLINDHDTAFYQANKHAEQSDKRQSDQGDQEVEHNTHLVQFSICILLIPANQNQAKQEEQQ